MNQEYLIEGEYVNPYWGQGITVELPSLTFTVSASSPQEAAILGEGVAKFLGTTGLDFVITRVAAYSESRIGDLQNSNIELGSGPIFDIIKPRPVVNQKIRCNCYRLYLDDR